MSDLGQVQDIVDDAPPTQPQGLPEAPTLRDVQCAAAVLPLIDDDQAIGELYSRFGAKSADDLAETDWREFIRLANMSCEDRAEVVGSKRTAPPPSAVDLNGTTTITTRDKAVALAEMGFRVFPVVKGTKRPAQPPNKPIPPRGAYHQHIPSSDPADVEAMWTKPNGESGSFDLGINTEGLLVLDTDDRDGRTGTASFAELMRMRGLDPDTVVSGTPSDGRHYFYKLPKDIDPATVKFGSDKLGSGIDHRSYNSFVVGAGTVRPGKGEYKWIRSPAEYEMREAPHWLVDLCRREAPKKEHNIVPGFEIDADDAIAQFREYAKYYAPEAVEGAGGRAITIAVLRRAGDIGLSCYAATEGLCELGGWNETKAAPPWDYDELLALAESLEPSRERPIGCASPKAQFEAVECEEENATKKTPKSPRLFWRTYNASCSRALNSEVTPLIKGYLDRNAMSVIYGDSNTGKTFFMLDLAFHLATGREWNGRKVSGGLVIYVAAEAGESINIRLKAMHQHYEPESEPPLAIVPCLVNLFDPNADLKPLLDLIREICNHYGLTVSLLVFDTLSRIFGSGDENSARDMGMLVRNLDKIRVATGAHVSLVHHSGKDTSRGARGSSALRAATDTEVEIVATGSVVCARMRKQRAHEEARDVLFRLRRVELGRDEDGDPVTTCVVEGVLDFEPVLTPEQEEWVEQIEAYAAKTGCTEFSSRELQAAWRNTLAEPADGSANGTEELTIRAVRKRAELLKNGGSLKIVSKSSERPIRYRLAEPRNFSGTQ